MIDNLKRLAFRISRIFAALVFIIMTSNFLAGFIYYGIGIMKYGWYSLSAWQIKMLFISPFQEIPQYSLLAFLLLFIRGIVISPYVLFKTVRALAQTLKYSRLNNLNRG